LAGIPIFAGFFSKDLILEELQSSHLWGPLVLCVAAAALTAFYMTRVIAIAFFGAHSAHLTKHAEHAHEAPPTMIGPMVLLAALAVVGGFFGGAFAHTWGEDYHFSLAPVGVVALAFAVGGIAVGYRMYATRVMKAPAALEPVRAFIVSGPVDRFWY